jgi:hypothetical protein
VDGAWLTYSLQDFLLFSPRTYYRLFELHNRAVWPAQLLAVALGAALVWLVLRGGGGAWRGRAVAAILAACWLWVGWAFLLLRYDTINWAARHLAAAFAAQALLLAWAGLLAGRLRPRPPTDAAGRAGLAILAFALVLQPLIGPLLAGRPWAQAELFGVAPDPTVAATLGVLPLAAAGRARWALMVVPLLWCAVSGLTLWAMGAPDALVMPGVGAAALGLAAWDSARGGSAASVSY